ncbi:MAG: ammonium transporter [Alphaproteobacteria bacterium]|nr:ammonium transporter [Alphaproteobacteria bacterium]
MNLLTRNNGLGFAALSVLVLSTVPGFAQDAAAVAVDKTAATPANVDYILNTLLFLLGGFLVMWMAAGFAMLEAGLVRTKNVAMQCTKNIALFSIAGMMFWLVGYNLMYPGDGGWIVADYFGKFMPVTMPEPAKDTANAYSVGSDWFFQMVFCATTASIVSGTLAERIKLWPFLIFVVILTGFIYPIQGSWEWGTGWLDDLGFSDFAGSTLVHSTGGWAALAGALLLGSRAGKYGPNGSIHPMPGSSMPLATLGTFILWLGWFGFNGGSQLAMGTLENASAVSKIFVNTNMAAAAGVIVSIVLTQIVYGKVDLTMALNGALAGLVSITAEPLTPAIWQAVIIGGVGGVIVVFTVPLLDKLRIDDVVGAIPVHLFAGIWGTLIVAWTNTDANLGVQALGVAAIGAFVFGTSFVVWAFLKFTIGLRPTLEEETEGLDKAEIGLEAYPEFGQGSQRI